MKIDFARLAKPRLLSALTCAAALVLLNPVQQAFAQAWPQRPVTVVVPFPAGGNTDTMARLASEFLTQRLGQQFIVENRPTAGGTVAAAQIARGTPDGYTLMFASAGQTTISPMLQKVNYDAANDFVPVSILGTGPFVLGVRSTLPVNNITEFLEFARKYKDKLNVSSAGQGSIGHLTSGLLAKRAGYEVVFVPYQGGGPAMNALLNHEVDMYFGNASELLQHADGGRIKILAVSSLERMKQLPNTPTIASIYPGFETSSWNGFLVQKGTPQEIVDRLQNEVIAAARDPKIAGRLDALGIRPIGSTAKEMAETMAKERPVYAEAVEAAGLMQTRKTP